MNAIEKIHSLDKFGSRPGLDRVTRLLDLLGNPQDSLRFVHVAGTNGKGSTCRIISSVLTSAGIRTGLFISPYIVDFRERIQINDELISEQTLEDAVGRTFPILQRLSDEGCVITEFEYLTALAFLIFKEANCDIVVLETGMGGLLDSTNVIDPPLCSVITAIGLDHTAILGDTIEEIAIQKCGIIKSGSVAVTSPQIGDVMSVIEADCLEKGVSLIRSEDIDVKILEESIRKTRFEYKGIELELPLIGAHQIENAKTALAALEILSEYFTISEASLKKGLMLAQNPARFELLSEEPLVVLDGAHNPNGIEALRNALEKYNTKSGVVCILGMLKDKDSESSLRLLEGALDAVYTVPVDNPRTLSTEELAQRARPYFAEVKAFKDVRAAFDAALERARKDDSMLLIAGSLYMAGEIRPYAMKILKQKT